MYNFVATFFRAYINVKRIKRGDRAQRSAGIERLRKRSSAGSGCCREGGEVELRTRSRLLPAARGWMGKNDSGMWDCSGWARVSPSARRDWRRDGEPYPG